jgi:hypothetical protein
MKREQIKKLEQTIGQIRGSHNELSGLAKRRPHDAVNNFKLTLINTALVEANALIGPEYRPVKNFQEFSGDDVPSNSDVTLILSLYLEALERLRSDNIEEDWEGNWHYAGQKIRTGPPSKISKKA